MTDTDTDDVPGPTAGFHLLPPWKGHRRWGCDHCPVDSLDEDRIRAHVRAAHGGRAAPAAPSGLVAADGTALPSTIPTFAEISADADMSPGSAYPPSSRPWSARTHDDAHTPTDPDVDSPRIDPPHLT